MQIKKVSKKVELNVSAQGCLNDCTYYIYNTFFEKMANRRSSCRAVTDSRWSTSL